VLVGLDVELELSEVRTVVADLDLLLLPVGLHQSQGLLRSQPLLLQFIQVLRLLEDHLFQLVLPFLQRLLLS
jgi:hypothetical protein